MNFQVDVVTLGSLVAIAIAISGWIYNSRRASIQEGKHLEEVNQLREETIVLKSEVKSLQECTQTTNADIREIKTDLSWIKSALAEIKKKLES
jgi:chromosome segregation ATPase